ncbi:glycoside hydrolase family 5 protein [Vibrio quintilis]|uniref:glycoside hydrolase family 5 protein n=1 Tax=Vibrio quintilis TaxID=1117707 RepID=UPI0021C6A43F|nr:glycoside hydrolase family 5 protein [Vibrio quintilis]
MKEWEKEVPIFVSEYGHSEPNGDGEVSLENNQDWYDIIDELGLSMCHWSMSDMSESAAMFVHRTPVSATWTDDDVLTASGGIIRDRLLVRKGYSDPQRSVIEHGKHLHMVGNPSSTPGRHVSRITVMVFSPAVHCGRICLIC